VTNEIVKQRLLE